MTIEQRVAKLERLTPKARAPALSMRDYESTTVDWMGTGDPYFPYKALVAGQRWTLRMNEWPDAPSVFTLFVEERAVHEVDDWPPAWNRPT